MLLFISCSLWCSENLNRNRRTRRGIKGEVAWMLAWAGPSEAEGPEGGAEARRCPRAGKRSRYFAVHQRGFLGAAAPKRPFRPFWAVPKGPRAGARNLPWQGCAGNTPCPGARNLPAGPGGKAPPRTVIAPRRIEQTERGRRRCHPPLFRFSAHFAHDVIGSVVLGLALGRRIMSAAMPATAPTTMPRTKEPMVMVLTPSCRICP